MISRLIEFFSSTDYEPLSSTVKSKIYFSLVDTILYKSLPSIWSAIGVSTLLYVILLFSHHDWKIHFWFFFFLIVYSARFLAYYIYFKSDVLSTELKHQRYSAVHIILWGFFSGLIWTVLLYAIKDYPQETKFLPLLSIVLFSLAVQTRYSLLPLWYVAYLGAIVVPLCIWLFLQGSNFILWGIYVLIYGLYTIYITYTYFHTHFNAIFLQQQNEKLILTLQKLNKKIEKTNNSLNKKNQDLLKENEWHQKVEKKLQKSATHDALTGLPNRLLLKDRVDQAIVLSKRKKFFFGILFIDLDYFKSINDNYGHEMGDKILQTVALRLKRILREEDTISRIGGDEFAVLISHLEKEEDFYVTVQKIVNILLGAYVVGKHTLICPASIGTVLYPSGGHTFKELIRNADSAMYKAKKGGRGRYISYEPPSTG